MIGILFLACVLVSSRAVPIEIPPPKVILGSRSIGGSGSLEGREEFIIFDNAVEPVEKREKFTIFDTAAEPVEKREEFIIFDNAAEPVAAWDDRVDNPINRECEGGCVSFKYY
ncbi:hypothetical protein DFH07DRAFT_798186 [Mycena maculata]|uniref:Uncharacterized protein n=1 Tax=Mycena maculata TaxID=230809 RepID=A0AAD7K6V0_9AGAR|nr:hypothetical protein DFH07DRAFT_798186 [Mycena maculata]